MQPSERPISDGPSISDKTWFALALSSAAISGVIILFVAIWVFDTNDTETMVRRAQAFTPFGAALLAIVTFFTIAWRGVLNTRALDHQAEQLRQQIRQNDASDEANLAKLLQEGARLLGERDSFPHQQAGIVTLELLLVDANERFGQQAMDVLADYLGEVYSQRSMSRLYSAAVRAINTGAEKGLKARTSLVFDGGEVATRNRPVFLWVDGLQGVEFKNAKLQRISIDRSANVKFERCTIVNAKVKAAAYFTFKECIFNACKIDMFDGDAIILNDFIHCNFSDAEIDPPMFGNIEFSDSSEHNFVVDRSYPRTRDTDWSALLQSREASASF